MLLVVSGGVCVKTKLIYILFVPAWRAWALAWLRVAAKASQTQTFDMLQTPLILIFGTSWPSFCGGVGKLLDVWGALGASLALLGALGRLFNASWASRGCILNASWASRGRS